MLQPASMCAYPLCLALIHSSSSLLFACLSMAFVSQSCSCLPCAAQVTLDNEHACVFSSDEDEELEDQYH